MSIHTETRERKLRARRRFWRDLRNQAGEILNAFCLRLDALFHVGACYLIFFAVVFFAWQIGRMKGWWQ